MTHEEKMKRLHDGARRHREAKAKEAIKRVLTYSKWARRDTRLWREFQAGLITRSEYVDRRGPVVPLPSSNDYKVARRHGIETTNTIDMEDVNAS